MICAISANVGLRACPRHEMTAPKAHTLTLGTLGTRKKIIIPKSFPIIRKTPLYRGFVGSVVVVLLFLMLIFWGLNIAQGCREPFGTIMAVGITSMFFWQVIINIGMTMGLAPVVGVPLPFISYGGSSVLTTAIGIGLLMNISMRRFMIE